MQVEERRHHIFGRKGERGTIPIPPVEEVIYPILSLEEVFLASGCDPDRVSDRAEYHALPQLLAAREWAALVDYLHRYSALSLLLWEVVGDEQTVNHETYARIA